MFVHILVYLVKIVNTIDFVLQISIQGVSEAKGIANTCIYKGDGIDG